MPIEAQQAAGLQPNPLMPAGPEPLVMEMFDGINTAALRPGVPDKQCAWIDGFMPLAPRNLRTLYGRDSIDTFSALDLVVEEVRGLASIVFFGFYNIGPTPFAAVFLSDGSVQQVNTHTLEVLEILAPGTIGMPSITTTGMCQYGNTYLIIVNSQPNGYWIWNGATVFTAGTLGPTITITDAGSGYASVPTIIITGGSGMGAVLSAQIDAGHVTSVDVVNAGSGYLAGESVTLTFSGGTQSGTGAAATAVMTNASSAGSGFTTSVNNPLHNYGPYFGLIPATYAFGVSYTAPGNMNVTAKGSGYTPFAHISIFVDGAQWSIAPTGYINIVNGEIVSVTITGGGACNISFAGIAISAIDPGGFYVSSVTVTNGGSGYSPSVSVTGSGGSSPVTQATYTAVVTGGVITSIVVNSGGLYGGSTPPTLAFADVVVTATATAELMPFGIQGTTVETYSGHVWVASGAILYFSAVGSASDFDTGNGGGNNTSSDSTLRVNYTKLINANGFLWLLGDSSLSYISGVQTGGNPITTTYTLQNADPEAGTPWPYSALPFGRDLVFANTWGVQIGRGGSVVKTSDMLDGVYNSVVPSDIIEDAFTFQPSAAKANIFGRKVWMLLLPIINPITAASENKLLMWDGKRWWASSQDTSLYFIAAQETNSLLTAWGTDGIRLFRLFQEPSNDFTKYVQSKLWDPGGYWLANISTRFWALLKYYSTTYSALDITIDNEDYPFNSQSLDISVSQIVVWTNNAGVSVTWTNSGAQVVTWYQMPLGIGVLAPTATAQQGVLTGFTIATIDADMAIISTALRPEIVQYRG